MHTRHANVGRFHIKSFMLDFCQYTEHQILDVLCIVVLVTVRMN